MYSLVYLSSKKFFLELCAGNTKLGFKSADVLVEGQVNWWSLYMH